MNYLGIDYGEKKIGLALSAGQFSRPYGVVRVSNLEAQIEKIKEICIDETVEFVVVGFPEQDKDSLISNKIKLFTERLKEVIQIPIYFQDETLSSKDAMQKMIEAGKGMKKRREDDGFAAAIILQDYLDAQINK